MGVRKPGKNRAMNNTHRRISQTSLALVHSVWVSSPVPPGESANAVTKNAASGKHHAIAHQHPSHTHSHHHMHIGMAQTRHDTAHHQSHVFRNGNTKATGHQHGKHRNVTILSKNASNKSIKLMAIQALSMNGGFNGGGNFLRWLWLQKHLWPLPSPAPQAQYQKLCNTTRPCCPNSCSTCFNTGSAAGCQAWPLLMRTLIMVCG